MISLRWLGILDDGKTVENSTDQNARVVKTQRMRQPALLEHWNFCKDPELDLEGKPEKRLRGGLLRLNTRVLRYPRDKANKGFPLSDCHLQRRGQIDICSLPDMPAKLFFIHTSFGLLCTDFGQVPYVWRFL